MGMPDHLLLVRHGESEGNVAVEAAKEGNLSYHTEEFLTTPGHRWRLTETGRTQAQTAGAWIRENLNDFTHAYVSPYVRTRETAAHLGIPGTLWMANRALRERDWGDIGSRPLAEFRTRPEFELNAAHKEKDPLYWMPPGGESIANVAEDRVRNVLSTMHRECDGGRVLAVTHGETMQAFRLVLERLNDEEFIRIDVDKTRKIVNCEIHHYTRINPETGWQSPRLDWVRVIQPTLQDGQWEAVSGPWRAIPARWLTNEQLLAGLDDTPELWER